MNQRASPAALLASGRSGVGDTRVFGASVRLAERGKPETVNGSEHAARKDLTILEVVAKAMEHEDGAFKVKIERPGWYVPARRSFSSDRVAPTL